MWLKDKKEIALIIRALKIINEMMPKYFWCIIIRAFVCAVSPFFKLYFSGKIIDIIIYKKSPKEIIRYVLILVIVTFICEMINQYLWGRIRTNQLIFDSWEELYLNRKGFEIDYNQVEDPDIRLLRQKIIDNRNFGGLKKLMMSVMYLLNNFFVLCISIVMLPRLVFAGSKQVVENSSALCLFTFLLTISVIIVLVITILVTKKGIKNKIKLASEISEIQKYSNYYMDEYLDDSKVGKDVRIYSQNRLIFSELSSAMKKYNSVMKNVHKNDWTYYMKNEISICLLKAVAYIYIGIKAMAGIIGAGSIVEFSGIISRFIMAISYITSGITEVFLNNKYLEDFFNYIDLSSHMNKGTKRLKDFKYLKFENVSFKYPNSEIFAIKDINVNLNLGEKVAVVGVNGSGKTTFVKLLCRLYDATDGKIYLDSEEIKNIAYSQYLSLFSIVFQDFRLFSFSIANNVSSSETYDEKLVWKALKKSSMQDRIEQMNNGINTSVFKDLDLGGIEISVGESQKIAIARALYKDSSIMIFDEPTAALDPISEAEIYDMINRATENKLVVFISHRLSSCKFCDRIIVFDKGKIVQIGTHKELLADKGGKYFELWNAQAKYYIEKK